MNSWQDRDNRNAPPPQPGHLIPGRIGKKQSRWDPWESMAKGGTDFLDDRGLVLSAPYSRACGMGLCLLQAPRRPWKSQPSEATKCTFSTDNRKQCARPILRDEQGRHRPRGRRGKLPHLVTFSARPTTQQH